VWCNLLGGFGLHWRGEAHRLLAVRTRSRAPVTDWCDEVGRGPGSLRLAPDRRHGRRRPLEGIHYPWRPSVRPSVRSLVRTSICWWSAVYWFGQSAARHATRRRRRLQRLTWRAGRSVARCAMTSSWRLVCSTPPSVYQSLVPSPYSSLTRSLWLWFHTITV